MRIIVIILLILSFTILLSSPVLASSIVDLQFLRDGSPAGKTGGMLSDIRLEFTSPVNSDDVEISIYATDTISFNPTYCDGIYCYVEGLYISSAGRHEIEVKHFSSFDHFTVTIDTGRPVVSGLRLYKSGSTWMLEGKVFDPIADSSDIPGSGISSIEIIKEGTVEETISPGLDAEYDIAINAPFDVIGPSVSFTVRAYDAAGNVGQAIFNAAIDENPPEIISVNEGSTTWYANTEGRLAVNIVIREDERVDTDNSYVRIGSITSPISYCNSIDSDVYSCTAILNVDTGMIGDSHNAIVHVRDRFGNQDENTYSITIEVDTTRPRLLDLWSDARSYSEPAEPFLSSGEFFAEFEDAPSGMDPTRTIARITSPYDIEISPDRCVMDGGLAKCYYKVLDTTRGAVTTRIVRGYDNSGNMMHSTTLERLFHIDNSPPVITVGIGSPTAYSTDNVVTVHSGSAFHARIAAVKDSGSRISRVMIKKYSVSTGELLYENRMEGNECTIRINTMVCDYSGSDITEDIRVEIKVYDGAGNSASVTRNVRTGDSLMGSTTWRVISMTSRPSYYFTGIPSQFSMTIKLYPQGSPPGTSIGRVGLSRCTSTKGSITDSYASSSSNNIKVSGALATSPSEGGIVNISCDLDVYAQRGRYISDDSERITVNFSLAQYNSMANPNSPYNRGSDNTLFSGLSSPSAIDVLGKAEEFIRIGEAVCKAYAILTSGSIILDTVAAATGDIASPVEPAAKAVDEATDKFGDFAEKACSYITCETPGAEKVLSFYDKLEGKVIGNLTDIGLFHLTHSGRRNVQDSLIQSVLSVCVPGIVKNVRKFQQVECGYALCLLDADEGKVPAAMCEYGKSTAYCEAYASEVFAVVPYGLIVKDAGFNLNSLLQRPITVAGGFLMNQLQKNSPTLRYALKLVKFAQELAPILGINFGVTHETPAVDYCDMLESRRA
ncbi:MAG: hypothetical protein ACMXYL_01360 [Candidatus Woesearchaeota archaeon]